MTPQERQREIDRIRKRVKQGKTSAPSLRTNVDVEMLKQQLARKQSYTGKKESGGGGLLGKVFDVLSRPNYAVAGLAGSFFDKKGKGAKEGFFEPFQEAYRGLTGKDKETFSDVLKQAGMKGGWQRSALGLGLDIGLDPTTYVGTGILRGTAKGVSQAVGTKVTSEALKVARASGKLDEIEQAARLAYKNEKLASGTKGLTQKALKKEAKKAGKEAVTQEEERIMAEITKNLPSDTPSKLVVKFAGKPILETERGYRALSYPGRKLAGTEVGQNLAGLFSNKSRLGALGPAQKVFQGRSTAEYNDWAKKWDWENIPLSKSEAKAFTHAREAGEIDLLPVTSKKGVNYEELNEKVQQALDELHEHDVYAFSKETEIVDGVEQLIPKGIMKPDTPKLENYVPHEYTGKGKETFKAQRRKAIASDIFKPAAERKIPTLKDAITKGLRPEEDIRILMMNRGAKSFSATGRGNYILDAVDNFGMKLDKQTANTMRKSGHRIKNVKKHLSEGMTKHEKETMLGFLDDDLFMDESMIKHLGAVDRIYRIPEEFERWVKIFDNIQNRWKAGATVYNPGHHTRNLATDAMLNMFDGTDSPIPYYKALKIMFGDAKEIVGRTKIRGQSVSNLDLHRTFKESGAAPGWITTNVDEGSRIFKGKITKALHNASGKREEFGRFAHWLDALADESKGLDLSKLENLQEAGRRAADRVRHWNIDYTDLTPFERTFMKRLVPFYTWQRHAIPLMIEAMATRPGRVAVLPKSLSALEEVLGVDLEDKLPERLTPKWLEEMGAFQIGIQGGNPLFMGPPTPIHDITRLVEGNTQERVGNLAAQVSPFLRIPAEIGTGRTLYGGGIPIKDYKSYLAGQLPITRNLNAINDTASDPSKSDTWTRMLQYLTGGGFYEVTPNRQKGELHRQIDIQDALLKKIRGR